jgi:hypothetical protein
MQGMKQQPKKQPKRMHSVDILMASFDVLVFTIVTTSLSQKGHLVLTEYFPNPGRLSLLSVNF